MVKIDLSKIGCHWCGYIHTFKCVCGYRTCSECLLFPNEQGCVHKKYEPVISDGWVIKEHENQRNKGIFG